MIFYINEYLSTELLSKEDLVQSHHLIHSLTDNFHTFFLFVNLHRVAASHGFDHRHQERVDVYASTKIILKNKKKRSIDET